MAWQMDTQELLIDEEETQTDPLLLRESSTRKVSKLCSARRNVVVSVCTMLSALLAITWVYQNTSATHFQRMTFWKSTTLVDDSSTYVIGGHLDEEQEVPHPFIDRWSTMPGNKSLLMGLAANRTLTSCAICTHICPKLAGVLQQYKVQPISAVPAPFELDAKYSGFYSKYINVMGIPVLSSDKTCNCVLQKAAWLVHGTLSHVKRWEEVVRIMASKNSRVSVMSQTEKTTNVPEHADLTPASYWDQRARGLGGTVHRPSTSGAEENIMCEPFGKDGYFGENILVHELVHGIARTGFIFMDWDGKEWDVLNGDVYDSAMRAGLWKNTYAATNKVEYFAEGTQNWFNTNLEAHCCQSKSQCNDGIHNCIDAHHELKTYDRKLYEHLAKVWVKDSWRPGQGTSCGCAEDAGRLVEGFVEIDGHGNAKGPTVAPTPSPTPPGVTTPQPDDDEDETIVPMNPCPKLDDSRTCHEEHMCKWHSGMCLTNCEVFSSERACLEPSECAWQANKCANKHAPNDIPVGVPVRMISRHYSRALFARKGDNWARGMGAGFPPNSVTSDGVWKIIHQRGDVYRIINEHSHRALYAHGNGNWEHEFGAGSPPGAVHDDGLWRIIPNVDGGYRIINNASSRALYANGKNWVEGVGAGHPPRAVHDDGVWELSRL